MNDARFGPQAQGLTELGCIRAVSSRHPVARSLIPIGMTQAGQCQLHLSKEIAEPERDPSPGILDHTRLRHFNDSQFYPYAAAMRGQTGFTHSADKLMIGVGELGSETRARLARLNGFQFRRHNALGTTNSWNDNLHFEDIDLEERGQAAAAEESASAQTWRRCHILARSKVLAGTLFLLLSVTIVVLATLGLVQGRATDAVQNVTTPPPATATRDF